MPVRRHGPLFGERVIPAFCPWLEGEALDVLNNSGFLIVRLLQKEEIVPDLLGLILAYGRPRISSGQKRKRAEQCQAQESL